MLFSYKIPGLTESAKKAVRAAKKERQPDLSYDDLDGNEYQHILALKATRVVFWSAVVAIIFVTLVVMCTPYIKPLK